MTYLKINANPYGITTEDCVTRALVLGTRFGYETITKFLDIPFFKGHGADSVPLDKISKFAEKTGIISNYDFEIKPDWNITQRDLNNFSNYGGMTMGFWLDHLTKEDTKGSNVIFLCKLKPDEAVPHGTDTKFHAIWGNVSNKEYADLQDTKDSIVFDMYVVDPSKMCKKDDERYFKTEDDRLKKENEEYKRNVKMKKTNESVVYVEEFIKTYNHLFESEIINENQIVDKFIEQVLNVFSLNESENEKIITKEELENLKNSLKTPEDMEKFISDNKDNIKEFIKKCEENGQSKLAKFFKTTVKIIWTVLKYGVPFVWRNKGTCLILILYIAICSKLGMSPLTSVTKLFDAAWETGKTVVDAAIKINNGIDGYLSSSEEVGDKVGSAIGTAVQSIRDMF